MQMHTASTTSLLQTSRLNDNFIMRKRFASSQSISLPNHTESIGSKYVTPVKPVNQALINPDSELKSIVKSDEISTHDINVLHVLNQKNEAIMNLEYNLYNANVETWKYQQKVSLLNKYFIHEICKYIIILLSQTFSRLFTSCNWTKSKKNIILKYPSMKANCIN